MESYSPSIQKICVFQKSQSEISNNGISYLNNFLIDLNNAILIESINNANQQYHKHIQMDDIENSILKIFPHEIADHIINQSKGRIQLSLKPNGNNLSSSVSGVIGTQQQQQQENSDSDEQDEDGFEIIPRENKNTNNNNSDNSNNVINDYMSKSVYSGTSMVSLNFPIDLVYQVSMDLIKRKKLIHKDTAFYQIIETQPSTSNIYVFISYTMETITTRILQRINSNIITEDDIRKTTQDDHILNQIRHSFLQINNIANKILNGESYQDLSNSISLNSQNNSSNNNNSLSSKSFLEMLDNFEKHNNNNNNNNNIESITTPATIETTDDNKEIEEEIEEILDETIPSNLVSNVAVNDSIVPSNTEKEIESITTPITTKEKEVEVPPTPTIVEDENISKPFTTVIEKSNEISDVIDKPHTTLKTTPTPVTSSKKRNRQIQTNNNNINNNNNNNNNNGAVTLKNMRTPSIFNISEPIDLVEVIMRGFHFELKNGMFLICLVLIGLIIQSFKKQHTEVY